MADLSFRANTTGGDSTLAASTIAATLPTGVQSGDLLVIWCSTGVIAPATAPDFQTPTGWALIGKSGSIAVAGGALNAKGHLFAKIAGGGESSVTLSTGGTNAAMTYAFSSYTTPDATTPVPQVTWSTTTGGPGTTAVLPSITTGRDRALYAYGLFQGSAQTATPPGGTTERSDLGVNGISSGDELIPLAGATGTRTFTLPTSADFIYGVAEFRSQVYVNVDDAARRSPPETIKPQPKAVPFDIKAWLPEADINRWFLRDWWTPAAAASGATGTVAYTNANDTASATGTTTVTGTVARTNANDTSSAAGTTTVTGTVARTNANDTSSASGTTTVTGTSTTTNAADTSSASGSVGAAVSGTVAYTNADDTGAASGTTTIVGTVARTNANDVGAASGTTTITGTVARTNANDTGSASGTTTVTGTVARTNADDAATAAGTVGGGVTGTAAITNGNDTSNASGVAADAATAGFWGGWLRKRKKPIEVEEALQIIEQDGSAAEQERAARIEAEALFARLSRAERALTEAQRRRAESERKWALAVAQRIERDREDEALALVALLMD